MQKFNYAKFRRPTLATEFIALTALIFLLSNLDILKCDDVLYCPDKTAAVCGQQSNFDCGSVIPKTQEIPRRGNKVNGTIVPWQVGISSVGVSVYRCTGTIISKSLVITAANCLYNVSIDKFGDLSKYSIHAGITSYIIDDSNDDELNVVQKRNVSRIFIPSNLDGKILFQLITHIVVLKTVTPFEFTPSVHHVCVQFFDDGIQKVQAGLIGAFPGWNKPNDRSNFNDQQFLTTESMSREECIREYNIFNNLSNNYTDIFCLRDCVAGAKYHTGMGSGLVIINADSKDRKYYSLIGILSFGDFTNFFCETDPKKIVLNVQSFRALIEEAANADDGSFESQRISTFGFFCRLPPNQEHLIAYDLSNNVVASGALVPTDTIVTFKCNSDYVLEGVLQNVCNGTRWQEQIPNCVKYCPKSHLNAKKSSRAVCYYQGSHVPCDDRIRAKTQAVISCANGFLPPQIYQGVAIRKSLTCLADGSWDYDKYTCNMQCGHVAPKTQEFSRGGNKVNITEAPWHVGVYDIQNGITFTHICGGTIITPNLVISAAHCFWDEANQKIFNATLFRIVAGKYFRDYNAVDEFFPVQKRNITEIYVQSSFVGWENNYLNDIAIVKVRSHFDFTESIRPICIEFLERAEQEVQTDLTGNFAGWGLTENYRASKILQSVSMHTLSYRDCDRKLKSKRIQYDLTNDKFCLYDEYGSTACRGDSGGGLVIPNVDSTGKIYNNLIGVVSHGPTRGDCANDGIVVMTNVQYFRSLIEPLKIASEEEF